MSDVSASELVLRADPQDVPWDLTVEVVVAGSGAAGWAAAIGAALGGASVLVLEKESAIGGTTAKAGGGADEIASTWLWICNHPWLSSIGVHDPKDDALRYLARLARPERYHPDSPSLGLPERESWRMSFGLLVTVVWLYLEFLRLLTLIAAGSE